MTINMISNVACGIYAFNTSLGSVTIDTAIEVLEAVQAFVSLEEENQDLHNKLQNADNQLTVLQDLIDKEREDRRRGDARQTHGE